MRAVLVGMNNPVSPLPEHVLYPYPPGCAGHRLWMLMRDKMPDLTRLQYLRGFERINLVDGVQWNFAKAQRRAAELPSLYAGRTLVLFGEDVRRACGLPKMLLHPQEKDGVVWRQLPHPSGRNLWYNDPECRRLAASLLEELFNTGKQGE